VRLRPARPEDAEAIARVHVQSWRETYPGLISDSWLKNLSLEARVAAWRENLSSAYRGPRFNLVAEDGEGGLCGFASGGPRREGPAGLEAYAGELWAIYLLKPAQGRGLGRALFEETRLKLKGEGFASMLVWVLKGNPAEGFYSHLGGKPLGLKKVLIDREHDELAYGWEKI
jgi:GNAT superfamily N-acetyltransferase